MNIKRFTFNHFQTNCYVVWDEATGQCAIVDPAMKMAHEDDELEQFIARQGLTPVHILLTHPHVDHIAGLRHVCERYSLPVTLHPEGIAMLGQARLYASVMDFDTDNADDLPRVEVQDNDTVALGEGSMEVRYVPGHCPGSVVYVLHDDKVVLTGDALFRCSIGRTDFPGGDAEVLITKLKTRVLTLPDDYTVLPGHGAHTTVGDEKRYNGFLQ